MEPNEPCRENLVIIGFMGTGKSTIGKQIGRRLGFQFLDLDRLIVEREGMPIADLFAQRGETAFRDIETETLRSLAHLRRCVIATGGGTVLREENRRLLREIGFVVCLTAREEVIFERVSRNAKRPLLHTPDPRATVSELLHSRAEAYGQAAQLTVDTSCLVPPEVVEAIVVEARRAFSWHARA